MVFTPVDAACFPEEAPGRVLKLTNFQKCIFQSSDDFLCNYGSDPLTSNHKPEWLAKAPDNGWNPICRRCGCTTTDDPNWSIAPDKPEIGERGGQNGSGYTGDIEIDPNVPSLSFQGNWYKWI